MQNFHIVNLEPFHQAIRQNAMWFVVSPPDVVSTNLSTDEPQCRITVVCKAHEVHALRLMSHAVLILRYDEGDSRCFRMHYLEPLSAGARLQEVGILWSLPTKVDLYRERWDVIFQQMIETAKPLLARQLGTQMSILTT